MIFTDVGYLACPTQFRDPRFGLVYRHRRDNLAQGNDSPRTCGRQSHREIHAPPEPPLLPTAMQHVDPAGTSPRSLGELGPGDSAVEPLGG
ncbi:hypothetical protein, partial [Micromonospora sp. Mcm103]|uniref:hypothetical protein n=1 Tax=Micromonospora sp. Mcm103 TaxID=2926015 RepID=UPI0021CA3E8E